MKNQSNVSDEIVFKVLKYVPVKSLLRFRCVSKQWLSIISNPQFVQSHLNKANEVNNLSLKRHISISTKSSPTIKSICYQSLDCENPSFPFGDKIDNADLLCSCNGLLLVGTGNTDHYLWNPSTRSYKQIPCDFNYNFKESIRLYGLGNDLITDTYKVIMIVLSRRCIPLPLNTFCVYESESAQARVYNCKTECWKKIDKFLYKPFVNGQGVLVNGAPHWIVARDRIIENVIIYFDMVEERFKEVETPLPSWLVTGIRFRFGVLGGSLCLVNNTDVNAEVWVMKEYGVDKCWTKLFNIIMDNFVPLCVKENEEVILEVEEKKLVMYNLRNQMKYQILAFGGPTCNIVFNTATCVESLVSPQ
ncbi:hypothetical protein LguiB_033957 [Lonicera macranthoides]